MFFLYYSEFSPKIDMQGEPLLKDNVSNELFLQKSEITIIIIIIPQKGLNL